MGVGGWVGRRWWKGFHPPVLPGDLSHPCQVPLAQLRAVSVPDTVTLQAKTVTAVSQQQETGRCGDQ